MVNPAGPEEYCPTAAEVLKSIATVLQVYGVRPEVCREAPYCPDLAGPRCLWCASWFTIRYYEGMGRPDIRVSPDGVALTRETQVVMETMCCPDLVDSPDPVAWLYQKIILLAAHRMATVRPRPSMVGMELSIGQIVHYKVSDYQAGQINQRRTDAKAFANGHAHPHEPGQPEPTGHIMPVGNTVREGDIFPAVVVALFETNAGTANLQVLLDGNDTLWATSIHEGDEAGTWAWPPRV